MATRLSTATRLVTHVYLSRFWIYRFTVGEWDAAMHKILCSVLSVLYATKVMGSYTVIRIIQLYVRWSEVTPAQG